jgi:hypothetical protein
MQGEKMQACKRCGKPKGFLTGLMSDYCDSCERIVIEERKAERIQLEQEKNAKKAEQTEQLQKQIELFDVYKSNIA